MIRLTNLADYAVVVMTAAAKSPERRLSAPEVALVTGIPVPTVAKLMGTLARAGLLGGNPRLLLYRTDAEFLDAIAAHKQRPEASEQARQG